MQEKTTVEKPEEKEQNCISTLKLFLFMPLSGLMANSIEKKLISPLLFLIESQGTSYVRLHLKNRIDIC